MNYKNITEEMCYSESAADRAILKIIRNNLDDKDKVVELTNLANKIESVDKHKYADKLDLITNLVAIYSRV